MTLPVYFENADTVVTIPAEFLSASGTPVDPSAVGLKLFDPNGAVTTYTYVSGGSSPNVIIKDSAGSYHIDLQQFTSDAAGSWTYVWTGVGGAVVGGAQIIQGQFRIISMEGTGTGIVGQWYCSKEELKSRLTIKQSSTIDDYELQLVCQTVTDWITTYCGRHFYQVNEARTYRPESVFSLVIDDLVSVQNVGLDYDGDGVYEVNWTQDVEYQLMCYMNRYNTNDLGTPRPYNYLQVTSSGPPGPAGGGWLPWVWPFTRQDRIQITGVWGWQNVPANVTMAALYIGAEMFMAKDSPLGVAGIGELGIIKIQASPWVVELLRGYKNPSKTVGV